MKKTIAWAGLVGASMFALSALPSLAQTASSTATTTPAATSTSSSVDAQIQALLAQVEALKAQIAQLLGANNVSESVAQQVQQTFQLTTTLHAGMSGEEVRKLQEILATDPTLFSKDHVTGFFGPLTEEAVTQFQKHFGIDAVGVVGPHTMEKINELLKSAGIGSEKDLSDHELGNLDDNETEDNQGGNASSTMETQHSDGSSSQHGGNGGGSSEHGGGDN